MKTCSSCDQELPDEAFPYADKKRGSRRGECRVCYSRIRRSQRFKDWKPRCFRCKTELSDATRRAGRRLCPSCDTTYDASRPPRKDGARRKGLQPCSLCGGPKSGVERARLCAECKPWAGYARSLRLYGMTPKSYVAMLESQGGGCAICGEKPTTQRLSIDHDHANPDIKSSVRGLLCSKCNYVRLAVFRDDSALMRRAADYLDGVLS